MKTPMTDLTKPLICHAAEEKAVHLLRKHLRSLRKAAAKAETGDIEGIHDTRVASRRVRVTLKEFKKSFPSSLFEEIYRSIRTITKSLGTARELDVCILLVQGHQAQLENLNKGSTRKLLQFLQKLRRDAEPNIHQACRLILSSDHKKKYKELLRSTKPTSKCLLTRAVKSINKQKNKLSECFQAWSANPNETELHEIRIRFKKLRYTCETYAEMFGKPLKEYILCLKTLQDLLGDWNDLRVLREYILKCESGSIAKSTRKKYDFNPLLNYVDHQMNLLIQRLPDIAQQALKTELNLICGDMSLLPPSCTNCPHYPAR